MRKLLLHQNPWKPRSEVHQDKRVSHSQSMYSVCMFVCINPSVDNWTMVQLSTAGLIYQGAVVDRQGYNGRFF